MELNLGLQLVLSIATLAGIDAEPQAPFAFPLSPSGFPLLYNVPSFNYQNSLPIQHQPAAYDDAFMIKKRVSTTAGCRNNDGALVPCAHSTHETPALRKSPTPRVAAQPYAQCNELENLVNKERGKIGLRPYHCDANMRWVANQHLDDADEGAAENLAWGDECNLHSWLVKYPCCYTDDFSNPECSWDKPYELSGWDKRTGYEISAWRSDDMTATRAINQWRGSSGHYAMIMSKGGWSSLKTVGCGWRNHHAHCWFADEKL